MNSKLIFFSEVAGYDDLEYVLDQLVKKCVQLASDYERKINWVNVIILTSKDHKNLNIRYLGHNYRTDVLTFDFSEDEEIEGEIYLDAGSLEEQAREYGVELGNEYSRLVIHGLLHLVGLDDKSGQERKEMKRKEDYYLNEVNE